MRWPDRISVIHNVYTLGAACLAVIVICAAWVIGAEQSHNQTDGNTKEIRTNTEQIQILTDLEKAKVTAKDAELATTIRLCLDEKIVDLDVCERARVELDLRNGRGAE